MMQCCNSESKYFTVISISPKYCNSKSVLICIVITTLTVKLELFPDLWVGPPVQFSKHLCDKPSRYSS